MKIYHLLSALAFCLASAGAAAQNQGLHIFVQQGDSANVANCINRHQDVDAFDDYGYTPLMYAADMGDNTIVKLLMDNGAQPNYLPLYDGQPPALHAAVINGHPVTADLLLMYERTKPDLLDSAGNTALYLAAKYGLLEAADVLLFHGASPSIQNSGQATALQAAAAQNDTAMVALLLRNGAAPGQKGASGRTAFSVAAEKGAIQAAVMLRAADTAAITGYPVHYAAKYAGDSTIECLRQMGLDMNEPGACKLTPRDMAIISGNRKAARKIAKYGGQCSSPMLIRCISVSEFQEFCRREFRMGLSVGIHELRTGIALIIGGSFRPAYKPALVQETEHLYYQLREKRRMLHLALEKRLSFGHGTFPGFGAIASIEAAFASGKYDGAVGLKPGNYAVAAPSLALYGRLKYIGMQAGCKYYNYQNQLEPPKWVATLSLTGYLGMGRGKYKSFVF